MSCISSNFSSFFLNSLNDPSEFSKYLSNGELKCTNFDEFQVFGCGAGTTQSPAAPIPQHQHHHHHHHHQQQQQSQQQQHQQHHQQQHHHHHQQQQQHMSNGGSNNNHSVATDFGYEATAVTSHRDVTSTPTATAHYEHSGGGGGVNASTIMSTIPPSNRWPTAVATPNGHAPAPQHFDGSFEFIKYLRHSTDFTPGSGGNGDGGVVTNITTHSSSSSSIVDKCNSKAPPGTPPLHHNNTTHSAVQSPAAIAAAGGSGVGGVNACGSLIDLDSSTSHKSRSASRKVAALLSSVSRASIALDASSASALDVFDHDSKQTIFDLQHMTSNGSSNSNESSLELLAFPGSHLNASNSNTSSSEGAACGSSAGEFAGLLTGASSSSASSSSMASKLLGNFIIKENFEVHPSHKVEEGIFQHMNKLPPKKKDTLKQLGVRFTGQMTLTDKSIVVDNFIRFCEEYDIKDHRPFLSLNQSGLNKPEQIKLARYLGQGLPTFTLFCIYSNFKNLFCTKRTEIYTKDGYNLPYILDKTKRFLANTTADLKNMAASNDGTLEFTSSSGSGSSSNSSCTTISTNNNNTTNINNNSNSSNNSCSSQSQSQLTSITTTTTNTNNNNNNGSPIIVTGQTTSYSPSSTSTILGLDPRYGCIGPLLPPPLPPLVAPPPRSLEQMLIYENFDVHETHRIEDGVCTHITRLPPKKQELLKQFGIQSSSQQSLSIYEKYMIIENFIKFCNEYQISDHRPFLDFNESALSKCEQLKFVRYLGQGLPNLTLNKIYVAFKELLATGRSEKVNFEGYNLDLILKKKRKTLYNRLQTSASNVESYETQQPAQASAVAQSAITPTTITTPTHNSSFNDIVATTRTEICNDLGHRYNTSFAPR